MSCDCASFVRHSAIPAKVIVLTCPNCKAEYVLYPNGKIEYSIAAATVIEMRHTTNEAAEN